MLVLSPFTFLFICVSSEIVAENNGSISTSELRWQSDFANMTLEALKELHHDVGDMNIKLDIGIILLN